MKIVSYLNVSNPNNLLADSGFVLQRLLLEALSDFGHEIVLLAPIEAQEHTAIKVISIEAPLTKYHARFDFDWKSIATNTQGLWNDVDALIVNQIELAAPLKALAFSESQRNIPIISYVHYLPIDGTDHERELIYDSSLNDVGLGSWILGTIKTAIECADACVVESKFAKELLVTQIGNPKNLKIIHPPIETELQLLSQQSFSHEKTRIIYNHRLYAHYGTAELFDWIDIALKGYENKCEILVTSPRGERTQNQRDLDINSEIVENAVCSRPYVKIVKARNRSEYHKILASVHLGIAPLRSAPLWNLSIADLLATGKPVLTSRSGAFPELLEDSPEYLFSDRDEFVMKLRKLIEFPPIPSPTLAERICDKFHPKNIASQWERLLVEILNEAQIMSDKKSDKNSKKMLLKPLNTLGNQLLQHNDLVTSLKWSPCGKYLASCSHDGLLRLWDSNNFQLIEEYSTNHERIQSLEWTTNGLGIIFIDDDGCVYRFSVISNRIDWMTKITPYALMSLCIDKNIIYCADRGGHIHKCDSETGLHIPSHNQVNQVVPKVYSSIDERYVLRLDRQEYSIVDVDNPNHILASGSSISILSSDATSLLASWQGREALFQSWPNSISSVFTVDKNRLVCCSADGTVSILTSETLKKTIKTSFGDDIPISGCLLITSSEVAIAFSSGLVRILSLQDLSTISEIRVAEMPLISVCTTDNRLVVGGSDSNIYVFNYEQPNQQITQLLGHFWHVTALAQCPVSGRLASGSKDYSIRIWNPDHKGFHENLVRTFGATDYVETLCWVDDTKVLSGSQDGRVIIWNVTKGDGQLLHTMRGWVSNISCLKDKFIVLVDNKNEGIYGHIDDMNYCIQNKKIFPEAVITSFVYLDNKMETACIVTSNGAFYTYSTPSSEWILCQSDFSKEMIKRISVSANGRFACIQRESFATEVWSISLSEGLLICNKEYEITRPKLDVTCLAISNDGLNVSIGGWSRYLELYHGSTLQTKVPMSETVRCVTYTPDEQFQIVGAWNGCFAVIENDNQTKEVEGINRGRGLSVAVCSSSDGEDLIAFGNADTTVTVYKLDRSMMS